MHATVNAGSGLVHEVYTVSAVTAATMSYNILFGRCLHEITGCRL